MWALPGSIHRSAASGSKPSRLWAKIKRPTTACTACQLSDWRWQARSFSASLADTRFELSRQKIVGNDQPPDLSVQFFDLFLVNLLELPAATLKHAGRDTLALNSGERIFRFDISDLLFVEDQQAADRCIRQCQI
jgi:hypothetical protein